MKCPSCNSKLWFEVIVHESAARSSHNIRMGISKAKERGKTLGRPRLVDHEKVAALRNKGETIGTIAQKLNVGPRAINSVLQTLRAKGLVK